MELVNILTIIMVILIFVIIILAGIYFILVLRAKQKAQEQEEKEEEKPTDTFNGIPREDIYSFMEFDEIKDSMVVRKKGEQYVMAIQCQGVNYDLLSEQEKIGVEEGFIQLLNTLRFPIQLYIQTRSLNLRDILEEYKNKIKGIQRQIEHLDVKIKEAMRRRRTSK